jgi:hypothetical protein
MQSWTRTLVFAAVFVMYFGCLIAAQSPSAIGLRVVGAFGAADASGTDGGLPPSIHGGAVGGIRISAGRAVHRVTLAAETEMNWTSEGHGETFPNRTTQFLDYRESRRDFVWSGLGGVEIWELHHKLSVHAVGGISWVKPTVHASSRIWEGAQKGWSDWVAETNSGYTTTWAPTLGADVLFHFGDWSAGPSFRWYRYMSNISPHPSGSPTHLSSVVLTAGYHF